MPDTATRDRRSAEPMIEVCTRLPGPIVDEIDRLAAEDDRTRSWVVRDVVQRGLAGHAHTADDARSA